MPDEPRQPRPAAPDEIVEALSFALRYDGRRRVHHADDAIARITAERLVEPLSGRVALLEDGVARTRGRMGATGWRVVLIGDGDSASSP